MPVNQNTIQNYINALEHLENNQQAIDQHSALFFAEQGLESENLTIKIKLAIQVMQQLYATALEEIPYSDTNISRQILVSLVDEFSATLLNNEELTYPDCVDLISQFSASNPIQTMAEAYREASNNSVEVIKKLVLLTHLYNPLCGCEQINGENIHQHPQFKQYDTTSEKMRVKAQLIAMSNSDYEYYINHSDTKLPINGVVINRRIVRLFNSTRVNNWFANQEECNQWLQEVNQQRLVQKQKGRASTASSSVTTNASELAVTSSFYIDSKTNEHKVRFINKKSSQEEIATNRAVNEAYKAIHDLEVKIAQAEQWITQHQGASSDVSNPPLIDNKEELYKNDQFFDCPINFVLMDGQHTDTTPYIYNDGYSYTINTFQVSPITRDTVLPPIINQPLIDAEHIYYQLMCKWEHLRLINPNLPIDFSSVGSEAKESAIQSLSLNEKILNLFDRLGIDNNQDKIEADYFIKHSALIHCIGSKLTAGVLPQNNETIGKHVESTRFTLHRAKQTNTLMGQLELALQGSDIITEMAQQIEHIDDEVIKNYRELKIKEKASYSQKMPEQSKLYKGLVQQRRDLEQQHGMLREWSEVKAIIDSFGRLQNVNDIQAASSSNSTNNTDKITVYFRIAVIDANSYQSRSDVLKLPRFAENQSHDSFIADFDYQRLADVITCDSMQGSGPIGLSEDGAICIENLHSHHYYRLIVGVQIDKKALSKFPMNESERNPNQLNVHSQQNFYWLEQSIACTTQDIVSIVPMDYNKYRNTMRMRGTDMSKIWPDGLKYYADNTNVEQQQDSPQPCVAASSTGYSFFSQLQQSVQNNVNEVVNYFNSTH